MFDQYSLCSNKCLLHPDDTTRTSFGCMPFLFKKRITSSASLSDEYSVNLSIFFHVLYIQELLFQSVTVGFLIFLYHASHDNAILVESAESAGESE